MEYRTVAADETVRWVEERTQYKRDEDGRVTHYNGIMIDITDRKLMETSLRESEQAFRTLTENSPDLICAMTGIAD